MEMQAIQFRDQIYCTVFVVQNEIVTVLDKFAGTRPLAQQWLREKGFPSSGYLLQVKGSEAVPEGFYINPGLGPFYHQVDLSTGGLTAASPQSFRVPVALENL